MWYSFDINNCLVFEDLFEDGSSSFNFRDLRHRVGRVAI